MCALQGKRIEDHRKYLNPFTLFKFSNTFRCWQIPGFLQFVTMLRLAKQLT